MADFFSFFPYSIYNVSPTENILVTDIIRAAQLAKSFTLNPNIYLPIYDIADNETPEMISLRFYNTTQYHWIIMLLNEKYDIYNDYPKSDVIITAYATKKYKNINGVHHYVNLAGQIVDKFTPNKIPVTNLDYETAQNEEKRSCKILAPELISEFIADFQAANAN